MILPFTIRDIHLIPKAVYVMFTLFSNVMPAQFVHIRWRTEAGP